MPRRRAAHGHPQPFFHKARGLYRVEITLGKRPDGRPNRRTFYDKTEKGVLKKLQQAQQEIAEHGKLLEQSKDSVKSLVQQWLAAKRILVKPKSFQTYTESVKHSVEPYIGTLQVKDFTGYKASQWLSSLPAKGRSSYQVFRAWEVLRATFKWAKKMKLVSINPMLEVDRPVFEKEEQRFLTEEEQRKYIAAGRKHEWPLFLLALDTGARLGEILPLQWKDINLDERTVSFNKSVSEAGGKIHAQSSMKTLSARRVVPLSDLTVQALRAFRGDKIGSVLVFPGMRKGKHLGRATFYRKYWNPFLESIGLEANFHSLRHTAASRWIHANVPLNVVARWLGHGTPAITLKHYGHLVSEMTRKGADSFDLLGRPSNVVPLRKIDRIG